MTKAAVKPRKMSGKMDFNFKPGEKVTAKWPGSNLYYPGIVTKLRRDHQYEIRFGDDTYHTIHPKHVHPWQEPEEKDIQDDYMQSEEPLIVSCQRSLLTLSILLVTIAFPMFVFWINLTCDRFDCGIGISKFPDNVNEYFDWQTLGVFVGWVFFQFFLAILPFGQHAEGQPLVDAKRLSYKLNGLHSLVTTLGILCVLIYMKISFDFVLDKLLQLITASVVTSLVFCLFLIFRSRNAPYKELTPGSSKNPALGYFFGRELNPRIADFDIKFFCLLRPSVIGWAVLDVLILYQEYQTSETFYPSIWVVGISQLFYILDTFLFEEACLSGWNINKEGCGFLLVFSSFCFCPFVYTLSLRFLLLYRPEIENYFLITVVVLNLIGYSIYRVANKQKDDFRRNPYHHKFATAKTIDTKTTRKIFVDGWWKHLRHPNYLGDLLIALSWCLPCGFDNVVPYTYFFYLFLLLTHRAYRDDQACLRKYGDSWITYCKHVRYRVIPYCY